jgi:hypothetical protein
VGKLSSYDAEATLVDTDYLMLIDSSDTGQSPSGSLNKMLASNVASGAPFSSRYLALVAGGSSVENIGAVESNVNTVAATGATETLDLSVYGVHDVTMDQSCAFTLSNPAPSGKLSLAILIIRGAFTPSFSNTMIEPDNAALTYSTPSVWLVWTVNGGTSYFLASAGKAFA